MNESLRMVLVLTIIAVVSGGSLGLIDSVTRPLIENNKGLALQNTLKDLIPEAAEFREIEAADLPVPARVFLGLDGGNKIGWGFLLSGPGFVDAITLVVAADFSLSRLLGIGVLEQKETPGLGAEMVKPFFLERFPGLSLERKISLVKNVAGNRENNEVQAISAATISTDAVLKIINENLPRLREAPEIRTLLDGAQ